MTCPGQRELKTVYQSSCDRADTLYQWAGQPLTFEDNKGPLTLSTGGAEVGTCAQENPDKVQFYIVGSLKCRQINTHGKKMVAVNNPIKVINRNH